MGSELTNEDLVRGVLSPQLEFSGPFPMRKIGKRTGGQSQRGCPLKSHVHDESAPGPFQVNEELLGVQAAAESSQRAVAADASMARHNDRERVLSDGSAYGPDSFWVANDFGDVFIADQFSVGDGEQCLPYFEPEKGSPQAPVQDRTV